MKENKLTRNITTPLSLEDYEKLKQEAIKRQMKRAELVRAIVLEYLRTKEVLDASNQAG